MTIILCSREVTKPKGIKCKRITKAKSRSLEELRDQLRWQEINSEMVDCDDSSNMQEQGLEKSDNPGEGIISNKTRNRLTALREYLKQYGGMVGITQQSFDSHFQFPPSLEKSSSGFNPEVGCMENRHGNNDFETP